MGFCLWVGFLGGGGVVIISVGCLFVAIVCLHICGNRELIGSRWRLVREQIPDESTPNTAHNHDIRYCDSNSGRTRCKVNNLPTSKQVPPW